MATKSMKQTHFVKVNGEEIGYKKIDCDVNGNPRYVIHFLALGIKPGDYGKIPGLTRYRAKWYSGGYVFQSYNLQDDLSYYVDLVQKFYKKRGLEALKQAESMSDDELLQALEVEE